MLERQHDEAASERWRKSLRNRKLLHFFAWSIPILAYWLGILVLWIHLNEGRQNTDIPVHPNGAFHIVFWVWFSIVFIILLLGVRKVKNYIKDGKVCNYAERLKNIGVVNKRGDAPLYMGKKPNPAIPGGEIYTFDDVDVDFGIFNEAAVLRGLRNIFCGFVRPDPGEVYGQIRFFVKPSAKISCVPLEAADLWIVRHMNSCGVFGVPGAGKTFGLAYLLCLYCLDADERNIDMEISLFDQKLTFAEELGIADMQSFYYGLQVLEGLETAVATLDRIKLNPDGKTRVFIIDEMVTFIERLDRKQADRAKSLLTTLVYEGREYGFKVILAGQSSHAERFGAGVRDSLTSIFYFGNPSETEKRMIFPLDIGLMDAKNSVGEGYFRIFNAMQMVERFSIKNAVPDFADIGAMARNYMQEPIVE